MTLRERQILEYKKIQEAKIYLRFDRDQWDFSFGASGIFRFGIEFIFFIYGILALIYVSIILFKICRPTEKKQTFGDNQDSDRKLFDETEGSSMFVLNQ